MDFNGDWAFIVRVSISTGPAKPWKRSWMLL